MDEEFYEYDECSDIDNWEDEEVFQDGVLERASEEEALRDSYEEDDWEDSYDWEAEREQAFLDDENKRSREDRFI